MVYILGIFSSILVMAVQQRHDIWILLFIVNAQKRKTDESCDENYGIYSPAVYIDC